MIFALNSIKCAGSERSEGLEESTVSSFSLVVLTLDLGGLGSGGLVDELESILVLTSLELILLVGDSLLVGLQVGIRSSLGSGGGSKVSGLSGDGSMFIRMYKVAQILGL